MTKRELQGYYWVRRNIQKLEDRLLELETQATKQTTILKNNADSRHGGTNYDKMATGILVKEHETVTIAEAIALYGGLEEELDYLDWLLDPGRNTPPAGIIRLLDSRRCESARRLKRIRDVFDSVRVDI